MKNVIAVVSILAYSLGVSAQLNDAQWVLNDNASVVDFREMDTVWLYNINTSIYATLTNASICDNAGNVLYFTNGLSIANINDTLPNGSGLSPCPYSTQYVCCGLNIQQAAIFIPKPGDTSEYYLFHFSNDTLNESRPGTIYYTLISDTGNGGTGSIVVKNVPILSGVALRGGGMTACKHADGRDYWLVMAACVTNKFYEFLVKPDTILGPYVQQIGPEFPGPYDLAYSKFSPDGSQFATGILQGPTIVMDFDRCSGQFSNVLSIKHNALPDSANPVNGCVSLEFSLSGRFLYMTNGDDLAQYDLDSSDIQDSTRLYLVNSSDPYWLHMLQLAPNGKLYCSTWNGGLEALHVVNYPDIKGDSAGFVYGGQPTLTQNSINVPNLINYRLGPLVGSGCDTILDIRQQTIDNRQLRLIPNPADKYIYAEMGMQGDYEFELLNSMGQEIATKQTHQVDIFDTENLAVGVYLLRVINRQNNMVMGVEKVVIQH